MAYALDPEYVKGMPVKPIKAGRQYEDALKGTEKMNLSAGIWYFIHGLGDRFSPYQRQDNLTIEEAIEFCHRIGVKKISFHYPGEYTMANRHIIDALLKERKMSVGSIAANLFTPAIFRHGGYSNHKKVVRDLALRMKIDAQKLCVENKCHHQTDWAGRDGFDSYMLYEPEKQWEWTKQAYVEMIWAVQAKSGIAIEFKPYDAMEHSVLKTVEDGILLGEEVEKELGIRVWEKVKRENRGKPHADLHKAFDDAFRPYDHSVGINIEDAHVYLSGRKVSEAVRKSIAAGRLFLRHENDCEGRIDNDRIFGTIHFWDALEATYVQIIHGYDRKGGWHEPDIFPQRDDPLGAFIACVNNINFFYALAQKLVSNKRLAERVREVNEIKHDSLASELLFDLVAGGVKYPKVPLSLAERFRKDIGKPLKE